MSIIGMLSIEVYIATLWCGSFCSVAPGFCRKRGQAMWIMTAWCFARSLASRSMFYDREPLNIRIYWGLGSCKRRHQFRVKVRAIRVAPKMKASRCAEPLTLSADSNQAAWADATTVSAGKVIAMLIIAEFCVDLPKTQLRSRSCQDSDSPTHPQPPMHCVIHQFWSKDLRSYISPARLWDAKLKVCQSNFHCETSEVSWQSENWTCQVVNCSIGSQAGWMQRI